jgi:hydrogenase maturation protein HypF
VRIKVEVTGIVQGVGFRPFVYRIAVKNNLKGYVRNRTDASVEILAEGVEHDIRSFLRDVREKKPPFAQIYNLTFQSISGENECKEFIIMKSSKQTRHSGSVIPPDIAICSQCLDELRDSKDPRYGYFFITCTNCGPRFTIIEHLPYDRGNTTMRRFPLCGYCQKEYDDPLNRRFHAQTIACPECGPQAYLTKRNGDCLTQDAPAQEAGRLLSKGYLLAVKGYGGFHIAASSVSDTTLQILRKTKHRSGKPFAIMAKNVEAARTFAEVTPMEETILNSPTRPIVLLKKKRNCNLSPLVAPDLHNIGVMLPYTAMHYMLFDEVDDAAFVMTSANPPNQPIINDNDEALKILRGTVDYFLFHNRKIAHRCDDSVLRVNGNHLAFLRRSRGYAPAPVMLKEKAGRCVIGLGGELNNTSCVLLGDKAFISQHIGDVENVETKDFLREATNHLVKLTSSRVEAIACDLHPRFVTTALATELSEKNGWELVQVQHHYAHVAALMMEHAVDEIVGIVCDGYGYGTDGSSWGGEILSCTRESPEFKRLAHLEKQSLLGGDIATRFPLRVAAAILNKKANVETWLMQNSVHLPHGKIEARLILDQLQRGTSIPETTSCGRVLDAVAAVLGLCYERSYEGEPAMKLESAAINGKDVLGLTPIIKDNVLETTPMLQAILENTGRASVADMAYSAHDYLAKGLASLAVEKALETDVNTVGFSGGAAYNEILSRIIRENVEGAGLRFLVHEAVPPGDGGISFGQAVMGGFWSF